jgi:hypothetical protein
LKGKPKGIVQLVYAPNDKEAYLLASQIHRWLGAGVEGDGAGWDVSEPKPIPSEGGDPYFVRKDVPPDVRYGGGASGLMLRTGTVRRAFGENTAVGALCDALDASVEGVWEVLGDPALSDGHFIIVVGQKP